MKKTAVLIAAAALFSLHTNTIAAQGVLGKLKQKVKDKVNQTGGKTDKPAATPDSADNTGNSKPAPDNGTRQSAGDAAPAVLKVYQNYDFVPGDKILFDDNFTSDQDGEFPAHWELVQGQGVINKVNNTTPAFHLTEGNYARVSPRMKTAAYLTDPFTIEYDQYFVAGAYGGKVMLQFKKDDADHEHSIQVSSSEVAFSGEQSFSKSLPEELKNNYENNWHHIAIACKSNQLKVYVDQYRILVVPDTKAVYEKVQFAGIGSDEAPIVFSNVRLASGGNMNMVGKKFTESKIITHGINFDVDKATIKPESMGTLNMIVHVLQDNPEIKFEVDGHTDNSGTAAHNLTLSQQRAEAVKVQLIMLGISAERLTAKGFGDTRPMSDNTTLEGKANNRRVEFVKL